MFRQTRDTPSQEVVGAVQECGLQDVLCRLPHMMHVLALVASEIMQCTQSLRTAHCDSRQVL